MRASVQEVVVDCCGAPEVLAAFWSALLDARWVLVHEGWAVVDARPVRLAFQRVPEGKQSPKNRLHLDVEVVDLESATRRACALGATVTGARDVGVVGDGFVVLQDPEGNELCLVADTTGAWRAGQDAALAAAAAPRRSLHLALRSDWDEACAAGEYRVSTLGASLDDVGFVHTSRPHQLAAVAAVCGYGAVDEPLVVLDLDLAVADGADVRDEDGGDGELYPHVYGPLRPEWVADVLPARMVDGELVTG